MKRLWILLLTMSLVLQLAACGGKEDTGTPDEPDDAPAQEQENENTQKPDEENAASELPEEQEQPDASKPEEQPAAKPAAKPEAKPEKKPAEAPAQKPTETPEQPKADKPASSGDPLSILSTVWNTYSEDEMFASSEPMSLDVGDTDTLVYQLTFPADDAALIDSAAALLHMMNMNTFTCGAYHAADAKNVSKLADDLRAAIQGKQWMCGFPDKLVIFTYDQYVVSLYGDEELVNTFRDKFTATYSDSTIAYDEAIL